MGAIADGIFWCYDFDTLIEIFRLRDFPRRFMRNVSPTSLTVVAFADDADRGRCTAGRH